VRLFTGIVVVVLLVALVSLGMTTLAYYKRANDTALQLDRARAEVQELRGRGPRVPISWEDSLREFAGRQELPYPRFWRFGTLPPAVRTRSRSDDGGRFGGLADMRERRRRAFESWFEQTITALNERANVAKSKEVADMSTRLAAALGKLNDLRPRWDEVRQMPDDSRREAAQRLYGETSAVLASVRELAAHDRQLRLAELARTMGQTNEQAVGTFLDSVAGIYDATRYNPGEALTDANLNPPAP
jgi:hypothetical protein